MTGVRCRGIAVDHLGNTPSPEDHYYHHHEESEYRNPQEELADIRYLEVGVDQGVIDTEADQDEDIHHCDETDLVHENSPPNAREITLHDQEIDAIVAAGREADQDGLV